MVEVNLESIFYRNSQYFRNKVLLVCLERTRKGEKYFQIVLFLYYCIMLNLKHKYMNIKK